MTSIETSRVLEFPDLIITSNNSNTYSEKNAFEF